MSSLVVVTTSYPEHPGDAQGHFVAAEVRRLTATHDVTVLAPGHGRKPVGSERVVSLGGGDAFGFPGALPRIRERPLRALAATGFAARAVAWLRRAPAPARIVAHFLLPCGVPIGTAARRRDTTRLEIVVHGSDARLFAALGPARALVTHELLRSRAELRCVSTELSELLLDGVTPRQRLELRRRLRVEPSPIDVPAQSRAEARYGLGIHTEARLAVVAARLVPGKRVDVALEACRRVGIELVVLGDGPERAALVRRFPEARFVGQVPRTLALRWLAAADALVTASRLEGAPTVVREARALGTPVVCLEAGDLRRWAAADSGIHLAESDAELGPRVAAVIAASSATASLC